MTDDREYEQNVFKGTDDDDDDDDAADDDVNQFLCTRPMATCVQVAT
jgi:hypothetical protein